MNIIKENKPVTIQEHGMKKSLDDYSQLLDTVLDYNYTQLLNTFLEIQGIRDHEFIKLSWNTGRL